MYSPKPIVTERTIFVKQSGLLLFDMLPKPDTDENEVNEHDKQGEETECSAAASNHRTISVHHKYTNYIINISIIASFCAAIFS